MKKAKHGRNLESTFVKRNKDKARLSDSSRNGATHTLGPWTTFASFRLHISADYLYSNVS